MKRGISQILALLLAISCTACARANEETENRDGTISLTEMEKGDITAGETAFSEEGNVPMDGQKGSGKIPDELVPIPKEYFDSASEQGTVE